VVRDRLAWPFTLERVVVLVDGALLYNRRAPLDKMMWVAALSRLPPGAHRLQTLVDASFQTGTVGHACHVSLRSAETFVTGGSGASIAIDVHVRDTIREFPDRVAVAYAMIGAKVGAAPPLVELARCAEADAVATARCVAEARVQQARRDRDVIRLSCYEDKRVRMEVAAQVLEATKIELDDPERAARAQEKIRILQDEIVQRALALEECVGESDAIVEPHGARDVEPGCRGTEPMHGNTTLEDDWGTRP
jgi:hypothetical protein